MRLLLKEIKDRYIQENFKKIQKDLSALQDSVFGTNGGGSTTIINTTERIPLDGTEPISGTIEPDTASTHDMGSTLKPLRGVYSDELYVSGNSLYVDGNKAINVDPVTNRLTYSNDPDQDLEVKSKGTGTLYIDSEGDILITSSGTVTINGDAVANYSFGMDVFEIPTQIIANTITLTNTPQTNSEVLALNGMVLTKGASYDYTISGKVITFNTGVLTSDGHCRINYAY